MKTENIRSGCSPVKINVLSFTSIRYASPRSLVTRSNVS